MPLFVLAVWLSQRVGGEIERRAEEQIAAAARTYGRITIEKLLAVSAILPTTESDLAEARAPELTAAAMVQHGSAKTLFGDLAASTIGDSIDTTKPTLEVAQSANGYDVIVARAIPDGMVLGRIDHDFPWQTKDVLGRGMEVCVLGPAALQTPIQCSAPLPAGALARLQAARSAASGRLTWSSEGEEWLTAYWELFLPSRFAAAPWTIVVSQPRQVALESIGSFYRVVAQAAALTLALIILLAGSQIRRTLEPLNELLRGTRRIAAQNFATPVKIASGDEFGDVGSAMNSMAMQLNHQFASLRALADIDRLILETAAIETVLETLLERLRSLVPHGEHTVLMIDVDHREHGRVYRASGLQPVALDRVGITPELRNWLSSPDAEHSTTATQITGHGVSFGAWPSSASACVAPLRVGDTVVGALIAIDAAGIPFTSRETESIRELAVRVAVAVAAATARRNCFNVPTSTRSRVCRIASCSTIGCARP